MYMYIFACLRVTYVCNFLYMYYVCASIKCQLSIRLPVGPSIRLSACTHIRLSICPSISLCILSIRLSVRLMYVCMCVMSCQMYEWLCCDCSKTLFPKAGRLNFFYGQLQKPKNFWSDESKTHKFLPKLTYSTCPKFYKICSKNLLSHVVV